MEFPTATPGSLTSLTWCEFDSPVDGPVGSYTLGAQLLLGRAVRMYELRCLNT